MTGLSFLVKTLDKKEVIHFFEKKFPSQYTPQDILAEIQTNIANNEILKGCDEISLVYGLNTYTLVPNALFDESKLSEYLKFNVKILAGDYITYDEVASHNINVVYVPLVNVNNYFFETFGSFQYYHATTLLLKHVLSIEKNGSGPKVYIHVAHEQVDFIAVNKGQLELCNSYPYKTSEDLAYYVLFAFEQLNWNPDSVATTLLGAISETDEIFAILYTYIRNIGLADANETTQIEGIATHDQIVLKES